MLLDVFSIQSCDTEQPISLFCLLVIGFKLLSFGSGLEGTVDDTSLVKGSGEMYSAEFLVWDTLFESTEVMLLDTVAGLSSILPVAVTPLVVVVMSVLVVVIVALAVACSKSAKQQLTL